jgi:hypothetical protein
MLKGFVIGFRLDLKGGKDSRLAKAAKAESR